MSMSDISINALRSGTYGFVQYRHIASAEQNLSSTDSEVRMKAVKDLLSFYNRFRKVMAYYRGCRILTIFAEHGHRRAVEEINAVGIDWRKAGFDAITLVLDVKHWEKLNYESAAAFDDLLNRAADALPWTRATLMVMARDYFNERAALKAKRQQMPHAEVQGAVEESDEDINDESTENEDSDDEVVSEDEDTVDEDIEDEDIEVVDIEVADTEEAADEEEVDIVAEELRTRFCVHNYGEDRYNQAAPTKLVFPSIASRITVESAGRKRALEDDVFVVRKKQRS